MDASDLPATLSGFNAFDLVVVSLLLLSGLFAFMRGLLRESLRIAGWIGAIFATLYGLPLIRPFARDLLPFGMITDIVTGLVIFLVTLALISFLSRPLVARVRNGALSTPDRVLGLVFGIARGLVVISLLYLAFNWVVPLRSQPSWLVNAASYPYIRWGASLIRKLGPDDAIEAGKSAGATLRARGEDAQKAGALMGGEQGGDGDGILGFFGLFRDDPAPPKPGDADTGKSGYNQDQRRALDDLIDEQTR